MTAKQTPRTLSELYRSIEALADRRRGCGRSLDEYLRAFLGLVMAESRTPDYAIFLEMCTQAFRAPPVETEGSWQDITAPPDLERGDGGSKDIALDTLRFLIADLGRMADAGVLDQDPSDLYFGVTSPSGHRWFNLDPCSFIGCAAAGAESIAGGDGELEVGPIDWLEVASLLDLGRIYE